MNNDIDNILDPDFPQPHLDPIELNDLGGEYDPSQDPSLSFENARYYIGNNKAVVEKNVEPRDPWAYERRKVADRFGMSEDELLEEPDNHPGDEFNAWA